jgi:hypothetical protein
MKEYLLEAKKEFFTRLDCEAKKIVKLLIKSELTGKKSATKHLLWVIHQLYKAEKTNFLNNEGFKSSYHNPITSDLEFLVARVLFHYSIQEKLSWTIFLRCQEKDMCSCLNKRKKIKSFKMAAPDIRVVKDGKTIAIIEIKARVGWMQLCFSKERKKYYEEKVRNGAEINIKKETDRLKIQIEKYQEHFQVPPKKIYLLLPSLSNAHRMKSGESYEDHENWVSKNSGLPRRNLIFLSKNLKLNLAGVWDDAQLDVTNKFESMPLFNK